MAPLLKAFLLVVLQGEHMESFGFSLVIKLKRVRTSQASMSNPPEWLSALKAERIFRPSRSTSSGKMEELDSRYYIAQVGGLGRATEALERANDSHWVEQAYIAPPRGVLHAFPPTDDWHQQIKLPAARSLKQWGGQGVVKVAVVDSGVDRANRQLEHVRDFDHLRHIPKVADPSGHGTHVCGIIAAKPCDTNDFQGIAYGKVLLTMHRGLSFPYDPAAYYRALRAASADQVINLSLGGEDEDPLETEIVERMVRGGSIVVAAMGNHGDYSDVPGYPAACGGVIAVGSVERNGIRADTSAYGRHITISAPGVEIVSTAPTYPVDDLIRFGNPPLAAMSGTSMATPVVTAVIAKMLSFKPSLDRESIIGLMVSKLTGSWSEDLGHGVVDVEALMSSL